MYFNYHAKAKNRIMQNKLVKYKFVEKYKNIQPALLLYFDDGLIMPIREHKFVEYLNLIESLNIKID